MDLALAGLLEATGKLPFRFEIPDVMFVDELLDLDNYDRDQLVEFGFHVSVLEGNGVLKAFSYFEEYRTQLSEHDCFALVLAEEKKAILMSGDRRLREISTEKGIEVHGILWIADLLHEHDVIAPNELAECLVLIKQHPRCRLPVRELNRRIAEWSA
ncbi:hypothetical protein [Magnetospira sp. QH-2]|uniref:hypothetical protein n=1 Tax=Magnetospira sp. (strain QH-2) TaxID=1288970 RepID=UPI0011DE102B|nr:hypothetical protein [Magnetospira sp. QH-2]